MVETFSGTGDRSSMPTIGDLIRAELDTGKTVRGLAAASGYRVKHQTFQELSTNSPKQFPKDNKTVTGMALALNCPESTVVLAYASGLGISIDVGSTFALRLPAGVDDLAPDMKNALVSVVRAVVKQNGELNALATEHPDPAAPPRTSSKATKGQKTGDSADDVEPSSSAAASDAITAAVVSELEVDGVDNNREQA